MKLFSDKWISPERHLFVEQQAFHVRRQDLQD